MNTVGINIGKRQHVADLATALGAGVSMLLAATALDTLLYVRRTHRT